MSEATKKAARSSSASGKSRNGTAQEVARRADVSVMTVSRALRGSPRVSEKTRERIVRIAEELGYQPNLAARALRTGRVDVIGFILYSHDALRGQFHSESLAGFEWVVSRKKYHINLAIPSADEPLPRLAERLVRTGRCGALVIQSDELPVEHLEPLRATNAPLILMNYNTGLGRAEGLNVIGYDNEGGVDQVVRHLSALGHRRIAFIGGTPEHHDHVRREAGFRSAMKKIGIEIRDEYLRPGHFSRAFEEGSLQTDFLLAMGEAAPTAVVCASDETALGALTSANRCGVKVPDELSITGFDDLNFSAYTTPPITTVDHSGWELGVDVAERLLEMIENPDTAPVQRLHPTRLIVRGTTGRPSPSAV